MIEHLGKALILLVIATLMISGIIIFKNKKTIHYTYAGSQQTSKDIGNLINQ